MSCLTSDTVLNNAKYKSNFKKDVVLVVYAFWFYHTWSLIYILNMMVTNDTSHNSYYTTDKKTIEF